MSAENETIGDIEKKLRELARAIKHTLQMPQAVYERHGRIENKPLDVYFAELADRIVAWRATGEIRRKTKDSWQNLLRQAVAPCSRLGDFGQKVLDTSSPWLVENLTPSQRDYAMRLAIERKEWRNR